MCSEPQIFLNMETERTQQSKQSTTNAMSIVTVPLCQLEDLETSDQHSEQLPPGLDFPQLLDFPIPVVAQFDPPESAQGSNIT